MRTIALITGVQVVLSYISINNNILNISVGENRCQNWEFLILPGSTIGEKNGYTGRPPGSIEQKYPPTGSGLMAVAMLAKSDVGCFRATPDG